MYTVHLETHTLYNIKHKISVDQVTKGNKEETKKHPRPHWPYLLMYSTDNEGPGKSFFVILNHNLNIYF